MVAHFTCSMVTPTGNGQLVYLVVYVSFLVVPMEICNLFYGITSGKGQSVSFYGGLRHLLRGSTYGHGH